MTIAERITALKLRFMDISEQIGTYAAQQAELGEKINLAKEEQSMLRGEYRLLEAMRMEEASAIDEANKKSEKEMAEKSNP